MRNNEGTLSGTWATFCRAAREDAGLTKAALARLVGVDRATIGRWESGESLPANGLVVTHFAGATKINESEALQAAGILSADTPPVVPTSEDNELRIIRESAAPERVKKMLIDYVHRRRAEQARERMEAIELALKNQHQ